MGPAAYMSQDTETESPEQNAPASRAPRSAGSNQPSFEDILAAANAPPPPPKPAPKPAERAKAPERPAEKAPPPKPSQPSFDDILAAASAAPTAAEPALSQPHRAGGDRPGQAGRGPRREERKMPVVVRKISLPRSGEPARPAAAQAEATVAGEPSPAAHEPVARDPNGESLGPAADAQPADGSSVSPTPPDQAVAAEGPRRGGRSQQRVPRAPQAMPESAYATPSQEEDGDFGALFAESGQTKPGRFRPGSKVSARVAHLGTEVAFLDLGGKGEGIIDLREVRNDAGELTVKPGDPLEGWVLSIAEGTVVVTKSVPKGAGREVLQTAFDTQVPVEGLVTAVNKGGLEVDLGGQRAFCPSSQIDVRFVDDTSVFVGQKLLFRVLELRGGNAVLSRRALLEEERKSQAEALRKQLDVGVQLPGTILSVRDFGAFVDLGGLEGLIHVSELSHARVAHAQDVVKVGQKVVVQVLRIEPPGTGKDGKPHGEKIALSLKSLEQDPWDAARPLLAEGKKLQGKVARLQPFGAFVELFPGVDGLVHVSALSDKHVNHPREVVQEGEVVWVQVESIDDEQRRVALRRITEAEAQSEGPVPPRERHGGGGRAEGQTSQGGQGTSKAASPAAPKARPVAGDVVEATVERCEAFGVFVTWASGAYRGLVPNPELGTPRGSDNKKTNPPGTVFKAQIIELDERGRYRLSKTSAEAAVDRSDYREYQRQMEKAATKGFGTLGDLLRARLGKG
jgi:small subunit ribosomal protein S1